MFLICIFFLITFKTIISSTLSDNVMKAKEFEQMEKKAKTFACNLLSDSSILTKKREKKIREYLKKNNFLKSDSESNTHEKIKQFKTVICYDNIYMDKANDILMALKDGNYDFIEDKSLSKYFDFDSKSDFKELTKNMKETNQIMEDLKKEEESLHEKRKDDRELDDSLKDIEKKMFKNPKYDTGGADNIINLNSMDFTTDREEREKKERELAEKLKNIKKGKKSYNESNITFKDIIENPELLRKYIGIKTLIGFIIFMVIITIIDNKNQKRMREEEEKERQMKEKENKENKNEENKENKSEDNKPEENKENKEENKDENKENKNDDKNINKDEIIKEKID